MTVGFLKKWEGLAGISGCLLTLGGGGRGGGFFLCANCGVGSKTSAPNGSSFQLVTGEYLLTVKPGAAGAGLVGPFIPEDKLRISLVTHW